MDTIIYPFNKIFFLNFPQSPLKKQIEANQHKATTDELLPTSQIAFLKIGYLKILVEEALHRIGKKKMVNINSEITDKKQQHKVEHEGLYTSATA